MLGKFWEANFLLTISNFLFSITIQCIMYLDELNCWYIYTVGIVGLDLIFKPPLISKTYIFPFSSSESFARMWRIKLNDSILINIHVHWQTNWKSSYSASWWESFLVHCCNQVTSYLIKAPSYKNLSQPAGQQMIWPHRMAESSGYLQEEVFNCTSLNSCIHLFKICSNVCTSLFALSLCEFTIITKGRS